MSSTNNTAGAKSVTIDEQPGGTVVAEGPSGFGTSYDVYLRTCSSELLDMIDVTMVDSPSSQIILNPPKLDGTNFNNSDCKATVQVSAVDDSDGEGNHFVNIRHTVTDKNTSGSIILSDESKLFAANVLVQIYDDDTGGVIIEETNGMTATAEMRKDDKNIVGNASYYQDEYSLRLTKPPQGLVTIIVDSMAVSTDRESVFTPEGRDFTSRRQVYVNGYNSTNITFNITDWDQPKNITVTAIDDGKQFSFQRRV